jgi:Glyoxalase-like domain
MQLDHVFILCDAGAPETVALTRIGLVEGPPNVHPGQGTACTRFFFPNQYLELVWVVDPDEAQNAATRPTRLWDRWVSRRTGACPFGLVFLPARDEVPAMPFPTWSYRPAYLPDGLTIQMAVDTPLTEPGFFVLPFRTAGQDERPAQAAIPGTSITHLCLGTPAGQLASPAARWAASTGLLSVERSDEYALTVTFDAAAGGRAADARPGLPLVFRW